MMGRLPSGTRDSAPCARQTGSSTPIIKNNETVRCRRRAVDREGPATATAGDLGAGLIEDARLARPRNSYGEGGRWLYINIAAAHGVESALTDFCGLLLAGAYGQEAPLGHLRRSVGLTYYDDARSPGARRSAERSDLCSGVSWHAHNQISAGGRPGHRHG